MDSCTFPASNMLCLTVCITYALLFVDECVDDDRASSGDECLASWFHCSVEQLTQFTTNKICNILSVVNKVVFENSTDNYAYGTVIVKTFEILQSFLRREVRICTLGCELIQFFLQILEIVQPLRMRHGDHNRVK